MRNDPEMTAETQENQDGSTTAIAKVYRRPIIGKMIDTIHDMDERKRACLTLSWLMVPALTLAFFGLSLLFCEKFKTIAGLTIVGFGLSIAIASVISAGKIEESKQDSSSRSNSNRW